MPNREAPLVTIDLTADATDTYLFVTEDGFPDGRRAGDDVTDITLQAIEFDTATAPLSTADILSFREAVIGIGAFPNEGSNGPTSAEIQDSPLLNRFPYVGNPFEGTDTATSTSTATSSTPADPAPALTVQSANLGPIFDLVNDVSVFEKSAATDNFDFGADSPYDRYADYPANTGTAGPATVPTYIYDLNGKLVTNDDGNAWSVDMPVAGAVETPPDLLDPIDLGGFDDAIL